jgi:hypothetical protein
MSAVEVGWRSAAPVVITLTAPAFLSNPRIVCR